MLEHYLYDILSAEEGDFNIIILEDSPIFKGHFPEYPVVPGVCLMQIIKELAEKKTQKKKKKLERRNKLRKKRNTCHCE